MCNLISRDLFCYGWSGAKGVTKGTVITLVALASLAIMLMGALQLGHLISLNHIGYERAIAMVVSGGVILSVIGICVLLSKCKKTKDLQLPGEIAPTKASLPTDPYEEDDIIDITEEESFPSIVPPLETLAPPQPDSAVSILVKKAFNSSDRATQTEFLPDEIWLHILQFLDSKSLHSIGKTCTYLHRLCQDPALFSPLALCLSFAEQLSDDWYKFEIFVRLAPLFFQRKEVATATKLICRTEECLDNYSKWLHHSPRSQRDYWLDLTEAQMAINQNKFEIDRYLTRAAHSPLAYISNPNHERWDLVAIKAGVISRSESEDAFREEISLAKWPMKMEILNAIYAKDKELAIRCLNAIPKTENLLCHLICLYHAWGLETEAEAYIEEQTSSNPLLAASLWLQLQLHPEKVIEILLEASKNKEVLCNSQRLTTLVSLLIKAKDLHPNFLNLALHLYHQSKFVKDDSPEQIELKKQKGLLMQDIGDLVKDTPALRSKLDELDKLIKPIPGQRELEEAVALSLFQAGEFARSASIKHCPIHLGFLHLKIRLSGFKVNLTSLACAQLNESQLPDLITHLLQREKVEMAKMLYQFTVNIPAAFTFPYSITEALKSLVDYLLCKEDKEGAVELVTFTLNVLSSNHKKNALKLCVQIAPLFAKYFSLVEFTRLIDLAYQALDSTCDKEAFLYQVCLAVLEVEQNRHKKLP